MAYYGLDLDDKPSSHCWLTISKLKEDNQVHVVPRYGRQHSLDLVCWCNPEHECAPAGHLVVIHNMEH